MARWVKAHELIRMFKRTTEPTSADAPAVGDLWLDVSAATPIVQICTDDSPVAFDNIDTGGAGSNSFATIAVAGQSDVVADSTTDTLTLAAGANVTLTTNAATDTITITSSAGASAGGSDTQVQFNDGGSALGGDPGLVYNKTTNVLTCDTEIVIGGNATAAGKLTLLEDTDNGANKVTITAPQSIASDKTITLQDITGTVYVSSGTDVAVADGGTGASDAATALTNLGAAASATTITVAGTANQITSSAGAQDLSANRTWTLSLPADVLIPTVLTVPNTGLHVLDTDASHDLIIKPGSNITVDRTLTITTGDADRTITLSGDTTLSGTNTGDQTITLTGDVTGTGTGSFAATIANDAVTYAKIQNISATDKLLGRSSVGAGDTEEIACTAAGRAILDDADAAAQRTTLGLGTLATQSGTFSGTSSGTNTGDQNIFSTVAVSGQSDVVADTTGDTLTLVAGTNITITTSAVGDSVTINASGGATPAGSDTQIQFNDASAFGADAGLVYDKTGNVLTVSNQVTIGGNATAAGKLVLLEDTDDGASGVTITVPALAANYTLTLPTTDGAADEFLKTDGSGTLSWAAGGSGAPTTAQYVTLATDATLTVERVLTAGDGIKLTDAGAGSTVTVSSDFKPNDTFELYDDFITGNVGANGIGTHGWTTNTTGTGAGVAKNTSLLDTLHMGIMQLTTGTTSTGRAGINLVNAEGFGVTDGIITLEALVRVEDLSDGTNTYKFYVGLGDAHTAGDMVDGVYFSYSSADIAGDWQGNVAGSSTRTALDTNTAVVADTWYQLRMEINAAATSVEFFINGTSKGTIADANIPTATELAFFLCKMEKSAGTTSRVGYIDYFYCRKDFSATRYT